MKLSNICSQNFGKQKILSCRMINREKQEKKDATLVKFDSMNFNDTVEIDLMEQLPLYIRKDFVNENYHGGGSSIYVLKDDETDDVIGYAQTTRHLSVDKANNQIRKTHIDEIEASYGYVNAVEPLIAGIVQSSQRVDDDKVVVAVRADEMPSVRTVKFSTSDKGELFIPRKRYNSVLNKAQEHSQIQYMA